MTDTDFKKLQKEIEESPDVDDSVMADFHKVVDSLKSLGLKRSVKYEISSPYQTGDVAAKAVGD